MVPWAKAEAVEGKKGLYTGHTLKVEPTGFANRLE